MTALLGLFNAAKSHVVEYEGGPLFSMFPLDLAGPARLTIRMASTVKEPVQGLLVRSRDGHLAVAGESSMSLVLWSDRAPADVEVHCTPAKQAMRIWLQNCWRESGGVMTSLGSAGMRVEEEEDGVLIRASDWTSPPNFEDLVVRVTSSRG